MYDRTFRQQVSTSVGCCVILLSTSAISEIQADVLICYNAGSCVALEKMVWSLEFKCERKKLCMSIKAEKQVWKCLINIYVAVIVMHFEPMAIDVPSDMIYFTLCELNWSILMLCELNWYTIHAYFKSHTNYLNVVCIL